MAIPLAQQRKVLQRSGNICAFPGCSLLLTAEGAEDDPVVVLGEIAHIVAESPNGPRGKSPLTIKQRNLYANLILLCNQHHQLIDSDGALAMYTVDRLKAMKAAHEGWVERSLAGRRNAAPDLPPMRQDTVYSNLLPVRQMPRFIFGAPCLIEKENDVVPDGAPESIMTPRIVRGGWLWAFQDLRDEHGPFAHAVTTTEVEQHLAEEWWSEPDHLGWYIALLNRSLNKLTGRLGLRLDRSHRRYYFEPDDPGSQMQITYRPLNASKATRSVVWQPVSKATGVPRNYWLHRAVHLRFVQASTAEWHLSIRPELRVTSNGIDSIDAKYIGRRVTKSKSRWFNYDLLGEVQFWRDFLSQSSSMITLPFGSTDQRLLISNSMTKTKIQWPGIPDEYAMPFKNVEYLDDLSTWAEAEELIGESSDDHELAQAVTWDSDADDDELSA